MIVFSPPRACTETRPAHSSWRESPRRSLPGGVLYCTKLNILVEENLSAASRYHGAITQLARIAGQKQADSFATAKMACEFCLSECRRTMDAIKMHKLHHGC